VTLSLGAIAAAAAATSAAAGGFYTQEQSVQGLGRAYSGEAAASGPDELWWNPAAIGDVDGKQVYAGGSIINDKVNDNNVGSVVHSPVVGPYGVSGVQNSSINSVSFLPSSAGAIRLNDQWVAGLALSAPFGFDASTAPNAWTRYQATKVKLVDIDIQPTLAWRPTPWLDLGVGLDARYGDTRLTVALPNLTPLAPDGGAVVTGKGWNYGWTIGAQAHPNQQVSLGLSYRASIHQSLSGDTTTTGLLGPLAVGDGQGGSNVVFNTPWMATAAIRWKARDNVTLEAEVQRVGWSVYDTVHIVAKGAALTPVPHTGDTTSVAVGVDYAPTQRLTLRTGMQYDPQAIQNSAILADGDKLLLGAGASYVASKSTTFDLAVAYAFYRDSPINNLTTAFAGTPVATPINLTGTFASHVLLLSFGVHKTF
jgi:long-chain fatty acid transport protein